MVCVLVRVASRTAPAINEFVQRIGSVQKIQLTENYDRSQWIRNDWHGTFIMISMRS